MAKGTSTDLRERGMGELVKELAGQVSTLVRQEIELAKTEMGEKGKKAGLGAGMLGGAGVAALLMLGSLSASMIIVLALVMPAWASALIVTALWGAVAGLLALQGRQRIRGIGTPVPEQTVETVKKQTRAKMGDTLDALYYKANVPARAKRWFGSKKDAAFGVCGSVLSSISAATGSMGSKGPDSTPGACDIHAGAGRVKDMAERSPLRRLFTGLFAPSARIEDEKVGPTADQVKSSAAEAAQEAHDREDAVAQDAAKSAVETAKEQHDEEGASPLHEKATEVAPGPHQ